MAFPAKTSEEQVLAVAAMLLERQGPDGLTMAALADSIGIKAPSLYKRFGCRADILHALERISFDALGHRLETHLRGTTGQETLWNLAQAYRGFVREHPRLYALAFAPDGLSQNVRKDLLFRALRGVRALFLALYPLDPVARADQKAELFWCLMHGFVTLEQARLWPDPESLGLIEAGLTDSLTRLLPVAAGIEPAETLQMAEI